jgi:hypothetical protein
MLMNNLLVIFFMSLPLLVFFGLKFLTYQKYKKMEKADEIDSILSKHGHMPKFNHDSHSDKNDKAA